MSDLTMPGCCLSSVAGECDDSLGHCNSGTVMIVVIPHTLPHDLLHRHGGGATGHRALSGEVAGLSCVCLDTDHHR